MERTSNRSPRLQRDKVMTDIMKIEILPDGTIKTTTDPISGPNHQSAEDFLRALTALTGGEATRQARGQGHTHTHEHTHTEQKG